MVQRSMHHWAAVMPKAFSTHLLEKKEKSLIFIQADAMQYLPLNKSAEGLEALAGGYLGTA